MNDSPDEMSEEKTPEQEHVETLARERFQRRVAQHDEVTRQKMVLAMRENGADPAYIYAFETTGILVFQETMDDMDPEELELWAQAYEEYEASH